MTTALDKLVTRLKAPALSEPGPWHVDSHGCARSLGTVWIVQRELPPPPRSTVNGLEYLTQANGKLRRFRKEATAQAALKKIKTTP